MFQPYYPSNESGRRTAFVHASKEKPGGVINGIHDMDIPMHTLPAQRDKE
jgi:hypothetical protein